MTQGQVMDAINVLNRVCKQTMPLKLANRLFKLRQALAPAMQFQMEEEAKLMEKYPPSRQEGNQLFFDDKEVGRAFNQKLAELADIESDIEFKPVEIHDGVDIGIKPDDIGMLQGFVEIIEGDDANGTV